MPGDDDTFFAFNKTKETFLAHRVKVADSILSRLVGLLGKRSLEPGAGLWIVPSRGIHTLGMLFDIDVVFLDHDLKVVDLREFVRPFSITSLSLHADSVLELPAHTIFKSRTEIGDEVVITSVEAARTSELKIEPAPPQSESAQKVGSGQ